MGVRSVLFSLVLLIPNCVAYAGESERPAAPEPKPAHRFFDFKNSLALGSFATTLAGDSLSTEKGLSMSGFREVNPVARPFVHTTAGTAIYAAGNLGLLAGGMYLAHKTGHHKLERIVPFGLAAWEGLITARNYYVISRPR